MRIVKEHDERKNEILDTAERLFLAKGYEQCTVNDILNEIDIAKGTFYYYFKSKEEVMDAIVSRNRDIIVGRAEKILEQDNLNPEEKLLQAFKAMQIKVDSAMLDELHKIENVLLHQKTLNSIVTAMAPILAEIIAEGNAKQVWNCRYPLQYMQIFLAAALTLTDEGIFELGDEEKMKVMAALASIFEKMLGVPQASYIQLFMQNFS